MRRLWPLLLVAALLVLGGCGTTTEVREPSVDVTGDTVGDATPGPDDAVRLAVVTHGQASSPFWAIVRNGVEAAARQADVVVDYRAPDTYSIDRMIALIDQAIASRPDGLVVSLPEEAVEPAVRRAVKAGIPTVTINSGSDRSRRLGVLAHIGQPEHLAGLRAGQRLAKLGVRRALCINHQHGNRGLDARCNGLRDAMRAVGGTSVVRQIDDLSPDATDEIAAAIRETEPDGVLVLNATNGEQAERALQRFSRPIRLAVFDLGPDVLRGVRAGTIDFAVDQQAYLQGYLPVILLAQLARFGIFPQQGGVIATGPNFVTKENAGQAIELSRRSIR